MKTYKLTREQAQAMAPEMRAHTSNPEVAAKLRRAMSPQADGTLLVYVESGDEFAALVAQHGTEVA